ncbi:MAG TPA: hypothetical protein VE078_14665, partial [Thermoanaerobaculia bacterium]|nr:hypothetical protein [Thermoanaerobaculia bacterium]
MDAAFLLPHQERLLRRIEALETPLVQVWGWPGSGKSALLAAFCERQGDGARGLSLGELEAEGLRETVQAARVARWFVALGDSRESLDEVARWLHPGQHLVFASESRWPEGHLPVSVVAPQELLLSSGEVATFWHLLTGEVPSPEAATALWMASDGWYQPLRLALEATGGSGLESADPERLLEIATIRSFLRHEVLDALGEVRLALLEELPYERPGTEERGQEGWRVLDTRGLFVEGEERDRL